MKSNTDNEDTDPRREAMAAAIVDLCRQLIDAQKIEAVENDAAECAAENDEESDKPIVAKLALSLQWPAGARSPQIVAKVSYSVRRVAIAEHVVDPDQSSLELAPAN